jgi:hypothetical protein
MLPGDPQPLALTVHPPHLPTTSKEVNAVVWYGMVQTSSAVIAVYCNRSAVLDFCPSKSTGSVLREI